MLIKNCDHSEYTSYGVNVPVKVFRSLNVTLNSEFIKKNNKNDLSAGRVSEETKNNTLSACG